MRAAPRPHIRALTVLATAALALSACTATAGTPAPAPGTARPTTSTHAAPRQHRAAPTSTFTINFAGDVHFADRVGVRLAADPTTVFGEAAPVLRRADLTMVNLETAVTSGGDQQGKEFTFRAPPVAFAALRHAGVDVVTMANNHGADYGASGLRDTFAAIAKYHFPTIGIGRNAARAYAPYTTRLHGVKVAIFAASQVQDETLANFSAGPSSPGIASAFSPLLPAAVARAKAHGYLVIVYIHWGTEFHTCPNDLQKQLADELARAGATAVIGTHAHVLQGAGWRSDGVYVAYGLGNYLWWRSFGNEQDDNGVLTLTFRHRRVVADRFHPAHLDDRGVPMPATGAEARRIDTEWAQVRQCADLSSTPPS